MTYYNKMTGSLERNLSKQQQALMNTRDKGVEAQAEELTRAMSLLGLKNEHLDQRFFNYAVNPSIAMGREAIMPFKKDFKTNLANIAMASTGDPFLQQTSQITGLIEYITPELGLEELPGLFKETSYNAENLYLDVMYPNIGMTAQKAGLDDMPNKVPARDIVTNSYTGGVYQEYASFRQETALFKREYGNKDVSVAGFALILAKTNELLAHRANARVITTMLNAISNNQISYMNEDISLGIPTSNIIDFDDYAGLWGTIDTSANTITPSDSSVFPMLDIIDLVDMIMYRYKGHKIKIVMNGRTHDLWNQHPNITSYSQYLNANTAVVNQNSGTINTFEGVVKYLLTGMDVEVIIHNGSYIPDSNDPFGNSSFAPTSDNPYGTAVPVFPDGKLFVYPEPGRFGGGSMFEWVYTLAPQNGGMLNPRAGRYYMMIDTLASNTLQGVAVPEFCLLSGFNAGVRPIRYMDMFVVTAATVTN